MPRLASGPARWKAAATLAELDALSPVGAVVFIEAAADDELRGSSRLPSSRFSRAFLKGGLPVRQKASGSESPARGIERASIAPVARDLCATFSPHHTEDMKDAIRRLLDPGQRETYRRRIEKAPLRTWLEVASDVERIIAERRRSATPLQLKARPRG